MTSNLPRPSLLIILALAPSILLAGGARGTVLCSPQGINFTVEGKILRLSQGKFTVSSEGNVIFHVRYEDKTAVTKEDGSAGSLKDLRVGLKVRVDGELTEAGEVVAQRIAIQAKSSSRVERFQPTLTVAVVSPPGRTFNPHRRSH